MGSTQCIIKATIMFRCHYLFVLNFIPYSLLRILEILTYF